MGTGKGNQCGLLLWPHGYLLGMGRYWRDCIILVRMEGTLPAGNATGTASAPDNSRECFGRMVECLCQWVECLCQCRRKPGTHGQNDEDYDEASRYTSRDTSASCDWGARATSTIGIFEACLRMSAMLMASSKNGLLEC